MVGMPYGGWCDCPGKPLTWSCKYLSFMPATAVGSVLTVEVCNGNSKQSMNANLQKGLYEALGINGT